MPHFWLHFCEGFEGVPNKLRIISDVDPSLSQPQYGATCRLFSDKPNCFPYKLNCCPCPFRTWIAILGGRNARSTAEVAL